jgi:hypothetical protein
MLKQKLKLQMKLKKGTFVLVMKKLSTVVT